MNPDSGASLLGLMGMRSPCYQELGTFCKAVIDSAKGTFERACHASSFILLLEQGQPGAPLAVATRCELTQLVEICRHHATSLPLQDLGRLNLRLPYIQLTFMSCLFLFRCLLGLPPGSGVKLHKPRQQ